MSETICDRTDLPESMCSHCRGMDQPVRYRVTIRTTAKFAGILACGHRVEPGDPIGLCGDDDHGWVCDRCIEVGE